MLVAEEKNGWLLKQKEPDKSRVVDVLLFAGVLGQEAAAQSPRGGFLA